MISGAAAASGVSASRAQWRRSSSKIAIAALAGGSIKISNGAAKKHSAAAAASNVSVSAKRRKHLMYQNMAWRHGGKHNKHQCMPLNETSKTAISKAWRASAPQRIISGGSKHQ